MSVPDSLILGSLLAALAIWYASRYARPKHQPWIVGAAVVLGVVGLALYVIAHPAVVP